MTCLFVVSLVSGIGCGSKTGLTTGDGGIGVDPDVEPPVCEQLHVFSEPQVWWPATESLGHWLPALVARNGGFDLVVRRSTLTHPHIHARRIEVNHRGVVRIGQEQRVLPETHDNHYIAAASGRVTICSRADPGGPYRILLRSYSGAYDDQVATEIPDSGSCMGMIHVGDRLRVAFVDADGLGVVAPLSVSGELLGAGFSPLESMPGMESTIRIGAFHGGWAWLKRRTDRHVFSIGLEHDDGTRAQQEYEAETAAHYLRAEGWPLPDGTVAFSYVDTPDETEPGTRHLVVVNDDGSELSRHVSEREARFGWIEPSMTTISDGLLWATANAFDDQVEYTVELFTTDAELLGEPVIFEERGFGHRSRVAMAASSGYIAVAWDRSSATVMGNEEIVGAVLRCGGR